MFVFNISGVRKPQSYSRKSPVKISQINHISQINTISTSSASTQSNIKTTNRSHVSTCKTTIPNNKNFTSFNSNKSVGSPNVNLKSKQTSLVSNLLAAISSPICETNANISKQSVKLQSDLEVVHNSKRTLSSVLENGAQDGSVTKKQKINLVSQDKRLAMLC